MIVKREFEMLIANDHSAIQSIEVDYNGEVVAGFVKEASFLPLKLTLCKHVTERNVSPYHTVNLNLAWKITVRYFDGRIKVFE